VHPTFADPKTDFVFKRVFGAESRKHLLAALLNHLLVLEGDRSFIELQHLTPERRVDLAELKRSTPSTPREPSPPPSWTSGRTSFARRRTSR
jgi:hypothetical protein